MLLLIAMKCSLSLFPRRLLIVVCCCLLFDVGCCSPVVLLMFLVVCGCWSLFVASCVMCIVVC